MFERSIERVKIIKTRGGKRAIPQFSSLKISALLIPLFSTHSNIFRILFYPRDYYLLGSIFALRLNIRLCAPREK